MLKTTIEGAALTGVVVAIIAGSFYALGTVAHLSYFNALGFDAHQFPALGSEIHVTGFVYVILPALVIGVVALFYACLFVLINRAAAAWCTRRLALTKWHRIVIWLAMVMAAFAIVYIVLFLPVTLVQVICAFFLVGTLLLASSMLAEWVLQVGMWCFLGAVTAPIVIQYVTDQAYKFGHERAAKAGKNPATTKIEFTDGSTRCVSGIRIVCSEHFCGFHDTAKRQP